MISKVLEFINANYQVIGLCAAAWAFWKWHVSQLQKEAELLRELIKTVRTGEVRDFVDKCDYEEKWYSEDFHKKGADKGPDHALTVFSNLCYMRRKGLLSRRSFAFFEYDIELIFSDSQVIDYLYNLYHESKKLGMSFPFKPLLDYGFKRHLIKIGRKVFEDPNAYKQVDALHQYLEF